MEIKEGFVGSLTVLDLNKPTIEAGKIENEMWLVAL